MKVFTYPIFYKIIIRFGNIPLTILLIFYLIPSVIYVDEHPILLIPLIISSLLIFFLNKLYLTLYKIIPYKIVEDNGKLICSEFLFSNKEVVIDFNNISKLKGGVFEGKLHGILKVYDGKNNIYIGYFNKIKNSKLLGTLLLSKVNKSVYDEVIKNIIPKSRKTK
ncbi:MAG: hypothetical protein P8Z35_07290 [Ignavibacteriaceae bacterium]